MAQYLSAERAVRVNTDTPIEISLAVSDNLHTNVPQGQDSRVYTKDVKGTQVMMTSKSASANEKMYLKQNCHNLFTTTYYYNFYSDLFKFLK